MTIPETAQGGSAAADAPGLPPADAPGPRPAGTPAGPAPTPLPRLAGAMIASNVGTYIALLTPLQLLLTLHLTRIAGPGATAAFGLITGVGALLALVANPLAGRISDRTAARFGRRRTWILTGALTGSAVLATMAWTTQVWQVTLVWCAVQTLLNFQQAANSALMPDQVPPQRRGSVSGVIGLTTALGPLVGLTAVAAIRSATVQWLVVAVAGAVGGTVAVLLVRDPQHRPAGPAGDRGAPAGGLGLRALATSFWLDPRRHPAFGWAWLVRFLITCAYASGTYNAFYLMQRFGVPADAVGGVVLRLSLLSTGLLALVSVTGGFLSDRLRRQKPFVVAAGLLAALSLVLMATAPSVSAVYLASAVLGVGTGLFFSIDSALCVRVLPSSEDAGKDFAIINMANTIPQSLVPFVAPALLALGGYPALYVALAVLGVAGALAVGRLPEIGHEGDPRFALVTRPA